MQRDGLRAEELEDSSLDAQYKELMRGIIRSSIEQAKEGSFDAMFFLMSDDCATFAEATGLDYARFERFARTKAVKVIRQKIKSRFRVRL